MTVTCEFFKAKDFGGTCASYTLDNNWRYWRIKFGGNLKNEISSLRARAGGGVNGNVYGFTNSDYLGDFASLNIPEGWTSWWSYVGGALNDDIESALLVNRNKDEYVVEMAGLLVEPFKAELDAKLHGQNVRRRGDPSVYAVLWPSHSPERKYVRIEQRLVVELDWWPDYDARISYDIYFYLQDGAVKAYVDYVHTWVEGGIFSGTIIDELHPKAMEGAGAIDTKLAQQLPLLSFVPLLSGKRFSRLYLLPGRKPEMPPPNANFGRIGNAKEDCCLVVTMVS